MCFIFKWRCREREIIKESRLDQGQRVTPGHDPCLQLPATLRSQSGDQLTEPTTTCNNNNIKHNQGCINCAILLSGIGARGVSSEHMENVEMFSENCALVWLSENRDLVLGEPCSGPQGGGKWHMYHSDQTRFYQTDDSKVTRRLLKEKSKLTFVDV